MFDLITGKVTHAPRPRTGPVLVSIAVHAAVVGAVFVGAVMVVDRASSRASDDDGVRCVATSATATTAAAGRSCAEETGAGQGTGDLRRRGADRAAAGD